MRDAAIVEIAIREVATFCELAETANDSIDRSGAGDAVRCFAAIHAFLGHCGTVAGLLWSRELAKRNGGRTLADQLGVPAGSRFEDEAARDIVVHYDLRLEQGLARRGEANRILDFNTGDRDAFEDELTVFLRHYDPTVDTLTLMEEEFRLGHIAAEMADIRSRAQAWLAVNATFAARPATPGIPPRG